MNVLENSRTKLESEIASLRQNIIQRSEESIKLQSNIDQLNEQLTQHADTISELHRQKQEQEARAAAREEENSQLNLLVSELQANKSHAEHSLTGLQDQISLLTSQMLKSEEDKRNLEVSNQDHSKVREELTSKLTELQQQIINKEQLLRVESEQSKELLS